MKDILLFVLILLALTIASMAVIGAVFDRDYWRAVLSLVTLVLVAMAFYLRLARMARSGGHHDK